MPLTSMLASLVCVVAAVVMLGAARGTASRAAHAVMLGVMVALGLGMQHLVLTLGCAVALAVTALVLLRPQSDREARSCSLDLAFCAGLVALMGASHALGNTSSGSMQMEGMSSSGSHDPLRTVILAGAALLLVGGWALARRAPRRTSSAGGVAAWLMMLAMATMVTA